MRENKAPQHLSLCQTIFGRNIYINKDNFTFVSDLDFEKEFKTVQDAQIFIQIESEKILNESLRLEEEEIFVVERSELTTKNGYKKVYPYKLLKIDDSHRLILEILNEDGSRYADQYADDDRVSDTIGQTEKWFSVEHDKLIFVRGRKALEEICQFRKSINQDIQDFEKEVKSFVNWFNDNDEIKSLERVENELDAMLENPTKKYFDFTPICHLKEIEKKDYKKFDFEMKEKGLKYISTYFSSDIYLSENNCMFVIPNCGMHFESLEEAQMRIEEKEGMMSFKIEDSLLIDIDLGRGSVKLSEYSFNLIGTQNTNSAFFNSAIGFIDKETDLQHSVNKVFHTKEAFVIPKSNKELVSKYKEVLSNFKDVTMQNFLKSTQERKDNILRKNIIKEIREALKKI